jgi:hypothetical protein
MLALIMKKQEDIEFKADLDYIVRSRFNNKKKKIQNSHYYVGILGTIHISKR